MSNVNLTTASLEAEVFTSPTMPPPTHRQELPDYNSCHSMPYRAQQTDTRLESEIDDAIQEVRQDCILPTYSEVTNEVSTGPIDSMNCIINEALADVANRSTPTESPYCVCQEPVHLPGEELFSSLDMSRTAMSRSFTTIKVSPGEILTGNPAEKRQSLLCAYFKAIEEGREDLVVQLLQSGLVNAHTGWVHHESKHRYMVWSTPLMAAVKAKQYNTVQLLLDQGALVNGWAITNSQKRWTLWGTKYWHYTLRTPLQIAAQNGSLAIVKLLMEKYQADDSIVSPTDGQTALRLAADAKERDVVKYLPSRRGGFRLRWRSKRRKICSDINRSVVMILDVVQGVFYELPKAIVKHVLIPLIKWLGRKLIDLPNLTVRAIRRIPSLLRKIPKFLKEIGQYMWEFITKDIPKALRIIREISWSFLRGTYETMSAMVGRLLSFIHTAAVAVYTLLSNLTWIDVWHGLQDFVQAVINLPRTLWRILTLSWCRIGEVMALLFGCFGVCIWAIITVLWWIVEPILSKIFSTCVSVGSVIGHMFKELRVWLNPKTV